MLHVLCFWVIKFQAKCSFYQQRLSWLYYSQVISLLSIITVLQTLPCPTFFYLQSIVWETLPHWWPRHIFYFPGNIDMRYIPGNLNIFVWLGNESGPYFFKWLKVYWRYLYTGLGLSVPVDIHTRQFVQSLTPTSWFCRCYSKFLSKFLRFSTSVQSQNPWPMILTSAP